MTASTIRLIGMPVERRRRAVLLVACLVALALGVLVYLLLHVETTWGHHEQGVQDSVAGEVSANDTVDDTVMEATGRSGGTPVPMTTMPPPDAPLVTIFDDLAKAADAGHVGAACRLAWDLQRCHQLESRRSIPGFYVDGAARAREDSGEESALIAEVLAAEARLARDGEVCEGLPDDKLGQAAERMLQAAQLGHPASQAMFASWPPFGPHLSLKEAELAVFHRDHAMQFLRSAAAAGEPAALFGLFHACHVGEIRMSHGTIDVGRDPVCAMATAIALRGFADPLTVSHADQVIRESATLLDAEAQQEATQRAEIYRQRFQNESHHDFAGGVFKSQLRAPCSDLGLEFR